MTRGVAGLKEARSHLAGQRARSLQRVEGQGKRGGLDGPLPDGEQARLAPIASRQQGVRPADVNSQNGCYPRHGPVTIGSAAEPKSQLAARGHPRQAKRCDRTTRSGTTRAASPTIGSPSITKPRRALPLGPPATLCNDADSRLPEGSFPGGLGWAPADAGQPLQRPQRIALSAADARVPGPELLCIVIQAQTTDRHFAG